jgi:hypothetical protein
MKVKIFAKKHWSDASRWEMGEHIHPHVLKVSVMGVQYLSINYDVH